ncbi:DUF202 domain-containing protein [Oryzihumus leptocrescens]|uniref:Uncharacterized protein DUF202 n=1 Tax=Oryzihumus leptocrescens TaxID=297536 RepID=A0A542ZK06_9MICO|nr:DUF202 domain-containing protein [Oryzihumus leptocrescens]TQL60674.1 uncharacterized protein DUF202 [Oryzihumus leptocrescens]
MSPIPDRAALQPERTALSWQRTAITATIIMVPLVITDLRLKVWPLAALGSVATLSAAALVYRLRRRFDQLGDDDAQYRPFWHIVRVAVACSFVAAGGAITALVELLR